MPDAFDGIRLLKERRKHDLRRRNSATQIV